jgi:hypothetical protein
MRTYKLRTTDLFLRYIRSSGGKKKEKRDTARKIASCTRN